MATYNGEKYIKKQIDSILCQLDRNDELIISDDGSTDKTLDIIESLNDTRITVLYHQEVNNIYSGYYKIIFAVGRNFENAIKATKGDYIFLSDQDDIWLPNKVKLSIDKLQLYDLVVSDCAIIDHEGRLLKRSYFDEFIRPSKHILRTIYKSSFHGCCMAFRKDLKSYILPFPNNPVGHDTWIGLVAIKNFSIVFLRKQTLLYRVHDSNLSVTGEFRSRNSFFFKFHYRIKTIKTYLKIPVKRHRMILSAY
jgi:glycosyltransferase involved in cell wall biosynthesis